MDIYAQILAVGTAFGQKYIQVCKSVTCKISQVVKKHLKKLCHSILVILPK